LLQGAKTKAAIETAAKLTGFYSDAKIGDVLVNYGKDKRNCSIKVQLPNRADVDTLRVGNQVQPKKPKA
jgi:hypothetical protein